MNNWNTYKDHVKSIDPKNKQDIEDTEKLSAIVGALIKRRNDLQITQRELAAICGIPQSSVARIESFKTTPNLDTLLKIFKPLGLSLTVTSSNLDEVVYIKQKYK